MSSQPPLRRSRRLASIIPASYWISIGYSQDDAKLIEKLQNDLKRYCEEDRGETKIELDGEGGRRNEETINIPNRYILPHWKRFATALNGRTSFEEINIRGISLPVPVLDTIFPALISMNLRDVVLCNVGLGNDGFQHLSSFVKGSTSIRYLALGGEEVHDLTVAESLSNALHSHSSLEHAGFIDCFGNATDAIVLEKILESCGRIKVFGLAMNRLRSEAAIVLADFIRNNPILQQLDLEHNNISDNDALILAASLKKNTNLNRLDLQNNNITEEGEKALLNALYDPTSMDSVVESNHTCMAYTYDIKNATVVAQRPPIETEVLTINTNNFIDIKKKIRRKIVLALCGVDGGLFDLSHLNDLPLKLMPRVLELIQEFTASRGKEFIRIHTATRTDLIGKQTEKDTLSRLFHTLRGWELPLLFENLKPKKGLAAGKRKRKTRR